MAEEPQRKLLAKRPVAQIGTTWSNLRLADRRTRLRRYVAAGIPAASFLMAIILTDFLYDRTFVAVLLRIYIVSQSSVIGGFWRPIMHSIFGRSLPSEEALVDDVDLTDTAIVEVYTRKKGFRSSRDRGVLLHEGGKISFVSHESSFEIELSDCESVTPTTTFSRLTKRWFCQLKLVRDETTIYITARLSSFDPTGVAGRDLVVAVAAAYQGE